MITEQPAAFSPEDLRKNFERLQSDLNVVQNELDQALVVWRAILTGEKEEFKNALESQQTGWAREDAQWQKDREAYEQKIQELETFFQTQLASTDKNAVRALNELDAAWQQERLRWQQTVTQQARESTQTTELQSVALQQLDARVAELTEENLQLKSQQADAQHVLGQQEQQLQSHIESLESQIAGWQAEKSAWQQSLTERLNELRQNQQAWAEDRQQQADLIQNLQQHIVDLEQRLRDTDQTKTTQKYFLDTHVNSLDMQVATLHDFIKKIITSSNPQRRQADRAIMYPPRPVVTPPNPTRAPH